MSAVIFKTRGADSSVSGTERPRGAYLAGRITAHGLQLNTLTGLDRARRILPAEFFDSLAFAQRPGAEPTTEVDAFARWAPVASWMHNATLRVIPGPEHTEADSMANARTQGVMETVLNTAIFRGTDAQVLLARIYGSAEDGIFIAEHDRPWLAEIIKVGASIPHEMHRRPQRWQAVAQHLQDIAADPGPALLTCSQGLGLYELAAQETRIGDIENTQQRDAAWDALKQLDATTIWDQSIDAIGASRVNKPWLRLSPATFREQNYGDGYTAQDAVTAADQWNYRRLGIQT